MLQSPGYMLRFGLLLLLPFTFGSCSSFHAKSKPDRLGMWISQNGRIFPGKIELFKEWALRGDAEASFALFRTPPSPTSKNEVDNNCDERMKWLRLSVAQGHVGAMVTLSSWINHYSHDPAEKLEGKLWMLMAADLGDKTAIELLAIEKADMGLKRLRVRK